MKKKQGIILVNFGGPRSLEEIKPFLVELLTDPDVISTKLPSFFQQMLFKWIASKRSKKVAHDYESIGGKSPIFDDTEAIAQHLKERTGSEVVTFHRYLPQTHPEFLEKVEKLKECEKILVFPLFPQFSYSTTGSIARWFSLNLCQRLSAQFRWVKSYATHPAFVSSFQKVIQSCLDRHGLKQEETLLLFSAHGLPQRYVCSGDPYQKECESSFEAIIRAFPKASHQLCYQSLFGKEQWIRPYTSEFCESVEGAYRNVVVVPLSFTSDHIETLFEIEQQYLPVLKKRGYQAIRCPALNLEGDWIDGICSILQGEEWSTNAMLIRQNKPYCCSCCQTTCCLK